MSEYMALKHEFIKYHLPIYYSRAIQKLTSCLCLDDISVLLSASIGNPVLLNLVLAKTLLLTSILDASCNTSAGLSGDNSVSLNSKLSENSQSLKCRSTDSPDIDHTPELALENIRGEWSTSVCFKSGLSLPRRFGGAGSNERDVGVLGGSSSIKLETGNGR